MRLAIVGHAAEKFTPDTERRARDAIRSAIDAHSADLIVSGRSPMGGVDLYAEEIADELGIEKLIFQPKQHRWDAQYGFKQRNLDIARHCDLCVVVVVRELPPRFKGMRFDDCYHCRGRVMPHVKSGACWTAWKSPAREWRIV